MGNAEKKSGGISGIVDVSEMMDSSVHLHITAGEKDVIIAPTINLKDNFSMGDEVHFEFDGNVMHIFNPETTNNLEYEMQL